MDATTTLTAADDSGDRYGFSGAALHKVMLGFGFDTYTYASFKRKLIPLNGRISKSRNTLYGRRPEEVASRLRAAERFAIHQAGRLI